VRWNERVSRKAYVVLRLALLAIVVAAFTYTGADPDLWGHVRFGGDTIAAHRVPAVDRYSFTTDRPWINHEWLSECVMYVAYAAAGGSGLIVLKIVLLFGMAAALMLTLRLAAIPSDKSDVLVGLVLVATLPQATDVRPQLFSLVLFAWLITILAASRSGRISLLWLAVPMMTMWANLHGGWIVGAGTLALSAGAGLMAKIPPREKLIPCAVAGIAVAATLANPYGWHLWTFLRDTVGFSRANIVEWQPVFQVFRVAPSVTIIWVVIVVAAIAAVRNAHSTTSLDPRALAIVAGLAVASFRVNRLLAFFAISVVMLMARSLAGAIGFLGPRRGQEPFASPIASTILGATGFAIFVGGLMLSFVNSRCVVMDPVEGPEPEVVGLVKDRGLHGHMITWFNWGEYAIWHLAPAISVSMDGRRETVYSDAAIREEVAFYTRPDQRQLILDRLKPDYIWLPSWLEVVRDLQTDGWAPLFSGSQSVLLARSAAGPAVHAAPVTARRCFPGP
jgi:hypothetical protein